MPRVKAAEDAKDGVGFYLAIRDFTWAFNDGHVGASGGDIENRDLLLGSLSRIWICRESSG